MRFKQIHLKGMVVKYFFLNLSNLVLVSYFYQEFQHAGKGFHLLQDNENGDAFNDFCSYSIFKQFFTYVFN